MRELLKPYNGVNGFNYICILATEILGWDNLANLPKLFSGFESILMTLPAEAATAVRNLRLAGIAPVSEREIHIQADQYQSHHEAGDKHFPQRFTITDKLDVSRHWTQVIPADVRAAIDSLTIDLPVRIRDLPGYHDPSLPSEVRPNGAAGIHIAPLGFLPPPHPVFPAIRDGSPIGPVDWSELVEIAKDFDRMDQEAGRQPADAQAWYSRLHTSEGDPAVALFKANDQGLAETEQLELKGIQQLIGLPGSGKTTLLILLAAYLSRGQHRACFLFPSIEVATNFIETLARYGVDVALLAGRGEASRNSHARKFARAVGEVNNGFGETRHVARYFATNCALGGFASQEAHAFPHENPPCDAVWQMATLKQKATARACALAGCCGYQYQERQLGENRLWAGHVLSMDRVTSPLFFPDHLRHFELIARTADLLVIDECDDAQNNLDARSAPSIKLTGSEKSLLATMFDGVALPPAQGRSDFHPAYHRTLQFGLAVERLITRLSRLADAAPAFLVKHANSLHTQTSLLRDIFYNGRGEDDPQAENNLLAIENIWDSVVKQVVFRHGPTHEDADNDGVLGRDRVIEDAANLMALPVGEITDFYDQLLEAVNLYHIREDSIGTRRRIEEVLRSAPNMESPLDGEVFSHTAGLLTATSLLVMQYFGLARHLPSLIAAGIVKSDVAVSRVSLDMQALVPESLAGRMSGVRYTLPENGKPDVELVGFFGTPRLLPQRMHALSEGHLAVLLTSATSMLEQSPSFHSMQRPDYVLRRIVNEQDWSGSRYAFLPKYDPRDKSTPLRFSGADMDKRDAILLKIVDQLLGDGLRSNVDSAIADNDVQEDGVHRRAAFVVNSYDQCAMLNQHIQARYPAWRNRVRYLTQARPSGQTGPQAVSAAEVEKLGGDDTWDLLIFPMNAIGRGVNVVFQYGPRRNQAMLGSLFFLTRPHPRSDSIQLIQGILGRASAIFDQRSFPDTATALNALDEERRETRKLVKTLLRTPLIASRLGAHAEPFVADQMIMILQTIGRAMRGGCPAFAYFVDAAWAPNAAKGVVDTKSSSMLVMMQDILNQCLNHPDPVAKECYADLYKPFAIPLGKLTDNLRVITHEHSGQYDVA